jgi:hypothetical protein
MNGKIVVPEAADSAQGWSDARDCRFVDSPDVGKLGSAGIEPLVRGKPEDLDEPSPRVRTEIKTRRAGAFGPRHDGLTCTNYLSS